MATEDFTTYTEEDPNADLTVTEPRVAWDTLFRQTPAWLVKDKGAAFFNSDFTHEFESYNFNVGVGTLISVWGLSDIVGSQQDIINAAANYVIVYRQATSNRVGLQTLNTAAYDTDTFNGVSEETYFIRVTRNYAGNTYTAFLYTGSLDGVLVDTLTVSATSIDFRYVYGVMGRETSPGNASSGWTQNLNLNLPSGVDVTPLGSVWANPSDIVTISQTGPFSVTPLGSVWYEPSSIVNVYIDLPDLPRVGFKIFKTKDR